eukprot:Nitzschia sp. Nitz4//scaffold92_size79448//12011//13918//NITZ4_005383-RA/size79448-processed-gene-0.52-mRNA-1//1//CDS//3329560162//1963//frame0
MSNSIANALDRMVSGDSQAFIASSTWQGSKKGYYFGTADKGTGYYLDPMATTPSVDATTTDNTDVPTKKKRKVMIQEDNNEMRIVPLLEQAEKQAAQTVVMELTPKGLASASNALEKLVQKNAMQRAQFADEPQKYMNSELALHDQLRALSAVSANTQLYPALLEHPTLLTTLHQLLGHENYDVVSVVLSLYVEWLDTSLLQEDPDLLTTLGTLASRILEAWETIATHVERYFQENKNASSLAEMTQDPSLRGLENSYALMEALLELDTLMPTGLVGGDDSAAVYMVRDTKILSWMISTVEESMDSKLAASSESPHVRCMELLAFLAQREDVYQAFPDWSKLPSIPSSATSEEDSSSTALDGLETLLQVVGGFRKKQPADEDQVEYLENTCTTLSSCITFSVDNLAAFLKCQGIELVLRCLKERVHSGAATLQLLDFAGDTPTHKQACEHLVQIGGLKFLFPLWLAQRIPEPRSAPSAKAKKQWLERIQTQIIRIFYALSRHLDSKSPDDAQARFLTKFIQDDAKSDQLVRLLLIFDDKVRKAEYNYYYQSEEDETSELGALDAKLRGGGALFHRVGALTAFCAVHSKRCHARIVEQLEAKESGISLIKAAVEEFQSLLGEGAQRAQLQDYLDQL